MLALLFLADVFLVTLYFVESVSWLIRVANRRQGLGRVIAKTNFWLYSARALMIVILAINFYLFESGWSLNEIILGIQVALLISAGLHFLLLKQDFRHVAVRRCSNFIRLEEPVTISYGRAICAKLAIRTAISVFLFVTAIVVPILLAAQFPSYALTASIGTQAFNAVGTVLLLVGVEPILYSGIDTDSADDLVISYIIGRGFGFFISAALLTFGYL